MIPISTKIIESALLKFDSEIDDYVNRAKKRLRAINKKGLSSKQKKYIIDLEGRLKNIVTASPGSLRNYKSKFGALPKPRKSVRKKSFNKKILDALQYSVMRDKFYPTYFNEIGIKACVYCNAILTVSVDSEGEKKAKFQVDHYYPKTVYPCLSISFYNLYPVCASCNNSKSTNEVLFDLYSDEKTKLLKSDFHFELNKASVANYLLSRNVNDIVITFEEPKVKRKSKKRKSFQEAFDIQGIYDTQRDLAEEMILKAEVYTPSYKNKLASDFKTVFANPSMINRLLFGNYMSTTEIHKRPMSKFLQDLAKKLKLI